MINFECKKIDNELLLRRVNPYPVPPFRTPGFNIDYWAFEKNVQYFSFPLGKEEQLYPADQIAIHGWQVKGPDQREWQTITEEQVSWYQSLKFNLRQVAWPTEGKTIRVKAIPIQPESFDAGKKSEQNRIVEILEDARIAVMRNLENGLNDVADKQEKLLYELIEQIQAT